MEDSSHCARSLDGKWDNLTCGKESWTKLIRSLSRLPNRNSLRVGDYRVLFGVEGQKVIVYRIKHRKEAYR
ncbi:MAG: type II toxin-antitoxin system RelE/ParE family toxin [Chlorobiaceae bacterium]|nr:type II toxin-antitoxin system RelE/ParE family toxin [Chlorobiaceae bacterium]